MTSVTQIHYALSGMVMFVRNVQAEPIEITKMYVLKLIIIVILMINLMVFVLLVIMVMI